MYFTFYRWLCGLKGEPGFTKESFDHLKRLREGDSGWQFDTCGVIIDGMAIKEAIEWDQIKGKMVGLVDFGEHIESEHCEKQANEALVIIAVGIRTAWKQPLGYFLTAGVSAELQAQILRLAFDLLLQINVIPLTLTLDGMVTNVKTINLLGCSTSIDNLQCFFNYPDSPLGKIFVFFDACHMVKNIRNALAVLGSFQSDNGTVRWSYIVRLQALQSSEGLTAGNKLTNAHINWERQKMKVKLAVQTLSASTAKGIRLGRELGVVHFDGSEATESFILTIDHLFDVLNSHTNLCSSRFKKAIDRQSIEQTKEFLLQAEDVLLKLKAPNGKLMAKTKRSIAFVGLAININSLIELCDVLLLGTDPAVKPMRYLRTYCFSQDHLEIFFSAIRRAGESYIFSLSLIAYVKCDVPLCPLHNLQVDGAIIQLVGRSGTHTDV